MRTKDATSVDVNAAPVTSLSRIHQRLRYYSTSHTVPFSIKLVGLALVPL
jgi:hypothetical protein